MTGAEHHRSLEGTERMTGLGTDAAREARRG